MKTKLKIVCIFLGCLIATCLNALAAGSLETTKWEQLPDTTSSGMDIRCDRKDGVNRSLADDFPCTQAGPITKVILWGSWKNDSKGQIQTIHLSIHGDDPIGTGGPDPCNTFSKPATQLWSKDFNASNFTETLYYDLTPYYEYWWDSNSGQLLPNGDHQIWQYEISIDPCDAFVQDGNSIYWLDAHVVLGPNSQGQFGWKTSVNHWNDDAVFKKDSNNWNELRYPQGHPNCPNSIDLAFAIITSHPVKWLQSPDLSTNGLDAMASDSLILADDFECNEPTRITDITIWGSWKNDILPLEGPNNVPFTLSIHSDIPASQSPTGYSMPNEVLWQKTLLPSAVTIEQQGINEGWWDDAGYIFPGDHTCWKYVFHIPHQDSFCQHGEPNRPVIYWLSVQAHPNLTDGRGAKFGWKSSVNHWNDAAVWTVGFEPYIGAWNKLTYPPGHQLYGQPIDLAFALDGNIPCCPGCPDFDSSGTVDYVDLSEFVSDWLWSGPGGCVEPDLNCDGRVDFKDFAIFAEKWQLSCP